MFKLSRETIDECAEELKPLIEAHWEEVAAYKDKIKFCPDYDRYKKLEEIGILYIYVLRNEANEVIGYWTFISMPHLHYMGDVYAVNDLVFIEPKYRGIRVPHWFRAIESDLKSKGVSVISYHMKTYAPFTKLMDHLGFDCQEYVYTKYVRDE